MRACLSWSRRPVWASCACAFSRPWPARSSPPWPTGSSGPCSEPRSWPGWCSALITSVFRMLAHLTRSCQHRLTTACGWHVSGGRRHRLRDVSKTGAQSAISSRELLVAYLRAQVDELRAREPGARIDSPDAVHRMRVASRRLRSSMATFGPFFTGSHTQRLRDELQWMGTVLGPVRDVELMRAQLHGTAAILSVDADLAEVLAGLDHELAERHSQAHSRLIEALNSPRYDAMLAALAVLVTHPPWDARAATRPTLPALVA